jgi:hypothetical protein
MRHHALVFWAALTLAAASAGADVWRDVRPPSQVVDGTTQPGDLATKVAWAQSQARKASPDGAFWVGYSIQRLQGEHSTIGTSWGDGRVRPSVAEVLAGKSPAGRAGLAAGDIRKEAAAALERIEKRGQPEKKVVKDLGIFLKFTPGRPPALSRAGMSNLELSFDFEAAPLYWLGQAAEEQSLALIRDLYGRQTGDKVRRDLIAAAGCHATPKLVLPFLEGILSGTGTDELRKDAAFWVSQQASKKSGEALETIAAGDDDLEVQEQAVFALSQLPGDQGLEALIRLAKTHRDPRIRKKAVFWLGQSEDPRALETIVAIIKGK